MLNVENVFVHISPWCILGKGVFPLKKNSENPSLLSSQTPVFHRESISVKSISTVVTHTVAPMSDSCGVSNQRRVSGLDT